MRKIEDFTHEQVKTAMLTAIFSMILLMKKESSEPEKQAKTGAILLSSIGGMTHIVGAGHAGSLDVDEELLDLVLNHCQKHSLKVFGLSKEVQQ